MSRAIVQRPSDRGSCSTCCTGMCNVTIIVFIESCDVPYVGSFRPVQGFELGAPGPFLLWWVGSGDETSAKYQAETFN